MSHKVFICYDQSDEEISSDISSFLELSNIKTWIKSRDYGEDSTVYDISNAIRDSQCLLLVYSEDAKKSNYVTTEIDISFSSNIPILIFKIDDATIEGKLGFYLKDKPTIVATGDPKEKFSDIIVDVKDILNNNELVNEDLDENPIIPTDNHVFICYDDEDEEIASVICHNLEENRIKCWIKNRDLGVNDTVSNIKEHLESSEAVVLIHSANSAKSNYVSTDINIAMENNIPILLYKIDKYTLSSKLKEYVGDNRLDAYPDVNSELENLMRITSEILKNPVKKPVIKKTSKVKKETVEKETVEETHEKPKDVDKRMGFLNKKVIAAIIIVVIVIIVGIFAFGMGNSENNDSGEVKFEVASDKNSSSNHNDNSDVKFDTNSSKQSSSGVEITKYNIHDVRNNSEYSWSYSYFAYGTLGSDLISNDNYVVNTTFYDSNDKVVGSSEKNIKNVDKVGSKYLLGDCFIDDDNVKKIVVTVTDNNNVVAQDEYII